MKIKALKNPKLKIALSAVAIPVLGFILLNVTFLFDALFQSIIRFPFRSLMTAEPVIGEPRWLPVLFHGSFLIVIGLISWAIFRTKWPVLIKAIYMVVPAAVVLVTVGMFLSEWPLLAILVGGIATGATFYYFFRTKQPWQYWYAITLIAIVMFFVTVFGVEI